jgi:L-2-hydroxyglutarate oxidase LhgO
MDAYAGIAAGAGAVLVKGAEVRGLERSGDTWRVRCRDSSGEAQASARAIVNAAGLGAQAVMRMAGLDPEAMNLRLYLAKGDYFSVTGPKRRSISRLVYPTPREHLLSLGIHTVVSLQGGFKLGPSAYYVETIDYTVDESARRAFFEDVRGFLPFLAEEDLTPDMSGIRPKLAGPGKDVRDFHIAHESARPGFFNLCGIESPGLTSSLAIGEHVAGMVRGYLR